MSLCVTKISFIFCYLTKQRISNNALHVLSKVLGFGKDVSLDNAKCICECTVAAGHPGAHACLLCSTHAAAVVQSCWWSLCAAINLPVKKPPLCQWLAITAASLSIAALQRCAWTINVWQWMIHLQASSWLWDHSWSTLHHREASTGTRECQQSVQIKRKFLNGYGQETGRNKMGFHFSVRWGVTDGVSGLFCSALNRPAQTQKRGNKISL